MLDILSGGRLVAGFPVGTSMDTAFAYGQVPIQLREKHSEANDVIMQAWTQPGPSVFNGKFNKLRYVNIWPRPLQQPHPPVWIPGSGSLETWDWVLQRDYVYCYLSYYGYIRGRRVLDGFWERCAQQGVDDNPGRGDHGQGRVPAARRGIRDRRARRPKRLRSGPHKGWTTTRTGSGSCSSSGYQRPTSRPKKTTSRTLNTFTIKCSAFTRLSPRRPGIVPSSLPAPVLGPRSARRRPPTANTGGRTTSSRAT